MTTKKNVDELFQDLLSGNLMPPSDANSQQSIAEFAKIIEDGYEVNPDEVKAALYKYRGQITECIGVELSDDQLVALAGGKSSGATAGIAAGAAGGAVIGGLATAGAVYVGLFVIIK